MTEGLRLVSKWKRVGAKETAERVSLLSSYVLVLCSKSCLIFWAMNFLF
jgi:hypothetical protein